MPGTPITEVTKIGEAVNIADVGGGTPGLPALDGRLVFNVPISGAVSYQGTWDATANNPALVSGTGTKGHYYVVSVAGATPIDGISDWAVGDWIIFNGTVWQKVDNTEIRKDYGPLAADPSGTPSNGDKYYNTALNMEMRYDSGRAKWLSVDTTIYAFGRQGITAAGSYYEAVGGLAMTATRGYMVPHNGTVVSLAYTRDDTDAATFEVEDDGASLSTLASAALKGRTASLNNDFAADSVLAAKNQSGGNATTNVSGWFAVKWRA